MNTKKTISTVFTSICIAILLLAAVKSADGQGRYTAKYSKRDVSGIVTKLEQSSNKFRRDFDRAMDQSPLNGTPAEDRFNGNVRDYENSLDRLRREFDRNNSWWESRSQVQNVIQQGQPVNIMMNALPFRRNLERQWNQMRRDLNTLADTYDLPGLNGGGWNGGGGDGGGNVPSWAVGTFYARNPQNGGKITMIVSRNGSVSLSYDDGMPTYASMNGTRLTNGPYVSRVSRLSNGIRTTSTTNNDFIDYFNTWYEGGSGGSGGNVPSWALGTFYARNPQNGGRIAMTIDRNGVVTLTYDGTNTAYASLNGTLLTNGPYTSRISRIRNGIRTTSTTNNDVINYYRNQ